MLMASAAIIAPFASVPLPGIAAFVPISQSLIFVNDLITSMLLMSQFLIVGWRAILVLAVGYLFTALLASIQLLTFPGAFTPMVFLAPDYRPLRGFTNSGILASLSRLSSTSC
jgi:hypothetical protein